MRRLIPLVLLAGACAGGPTPVPDQPMPPGGRFEGLWDSNWGRMKLQRRGNRVWGTYPTRVGTVWGEVKGAVFRFNWKQMENMRWGRGYLVLSQDGRRMEGRWGEELDDADGGAWFAARVLRLADQDEAAPGPAQTGMPAPGAAPPTPDR